MLMIASAENAATSDAALSAVIVAAIALDEVLGRKFASPE